MLSTLAGAALAGLVGSPHCVGMCGGLATAAARRVPDGIAWSLGRLSTYALLGAIAGGTADLLPVPDVVGAAIAALMLAWFAAGLADLPVPKLPVPPALHRAGAHLLRRQGVISRFAFGMVNGLLPCGLVYAALSLPVALGSPLHGALAMVAFGLGTVPALAVATLGLRRIVAGSLWRRRVLALLVLVVGLGALFDRATLLPGSDAGLLAGGASAEDNRHAHRN